MSLRNPEQEPVGAAASASKTSDLIPVAVPDNERMSGEIKDTLLNLLPWGLSIVLHAGVIMLTIFVVWTTLPGAGDEPMPQVSMPPVSRDAPLVVEPTAQRDTGRGMRQDKDGIYGPVQLLPDMQPDPRSGGSNLPGQGYGPISGPNAGWSTNQGRSGPGLISTGASPGGGGGGNQGGRGIGLHEGGRSRIFQEPPPHTALPKKIIYIIDASGSLIDTLPYALGELQRVVNHLRPEQQFTVFFFQDGQVLEVVPTGWKPATDKNKAQAIAWCDPRAGHVAPQGLTSPLPAIKAALRMNPEVLYVLSDNITGRGRYELAQKQLLAEIDKANQTVHARIHTIQYLYPDPLAAVGMKPTLQLVAEQSGGVYTFVQEEDLGLR